MLNPPTESGFPCEGKFVLEWHWTNEPWVGGKDIYDVYLTPYGWAFANKHDGMNFSQATITRWSGPLDLEALLQQGGKG